MREILLDTETTGLDPIQGHKIVEIGCVELVHKVKTGNVFHCYINPERNMPEEAFKIHGISQEFLADKKIFKHIAQDFLEFIAGAKLVIHNARFDIKFLNYELKQHSLPPIIFDNVIDTLDLARRKFPGSPASLDALCKRFKVDSTKRTKHGALLDAELLAEVYIHLTGGNQPSMNLQQDTEINVTNLQVIKKEFRPAREFLLTSEEEEAHNNFIKKIKNNLWPIKEEN